MVEQKDNKHSKEEGALVLFNGSKTATGKQSLLAHLFTKHVGGEFDASLINEGSCFAMEYTGHRDKLILALSSVSGTTHWVSVAPTSTTPLENGRYESIFRIEDCIKKFGTNFKRLDLIQAYTQGSEDTTITLERLTYYPGTGTVIDPKGETRWTNKNLTGTAFIGDSIVQNAMSLYGDWNSFLGRKDCSNWGIGGQTTVHIEKRINDMLEGSYDTIVILCGINDIGNNVSRDTTLRNFKSMFEKIHYKIPDAEIYVISILPTRAPFFVDSQHLIRDLNQALKTTIEQYHYVNYVDCYSAFAGDDGYCIEDYLFDGLHPNEAGYHVIADMLKSLLPPDRTE
jgi:lysophospholipase L1-like esterase